MSRAIRNETEKRHGSSPLPKKQVSAASFASPRDEDLVSRAQKGDQRAFGELIERHRRRAFNIAYHTLAGEREAAQDVVQDAFLRAFENLHKFRGDSSFYTWFYRIVVNACLSERRRRRRWERLFSFWKKPSREETIPEEPVAEGIERTDERSPLAAFRSKQLVSEVQEALGSLPEKQRLIFQLKVFQEMSIREIAEVTGAAEGTVKSHLFRATRFLRKALKEWDQS